MQVLIIKVAHYRNTLITGNLCAFYLVLNTGSSNHMITQDAALQMVQQHLAKLKKL